MKYLILFLFSMVAFADPSPSPNPYIFHNWVRLSSDQGIPNPAVSPVTVFWNQSDCVSDGSTCATLDQGDGTQATLTTSDLSSSGTQIVTNPTAVASTTAAASAAATVAATAHAQRIAVLKNLALITDVPTRNVLIALLKELQVAQ